MSAMASTPKRQRLNTGFAALSSPPRQEFREKIARIFVVSGATGNERFRAIVDDYAFLVSDESRSKQKIKWVCVRHPSDLGNCPSSFYTTSFVDESVPFGFIAHNHHPSHNLMEYYTTSKYALNRDDPYLPPPAILSLSSTPGPSSPVKSRFATSSIADNMKRKASSSTMGSLPTKSSKMNEPMYFERGPADSVDLFRDLCDEEERSDEYQPSSNGAHMKVEIGQTIVSKYFIVRKAGFGNSAIAWLAFDKTENRFCVLKIFKHPKDTAEEIRVLEEARNLSHCPGSDKVVHMLNAFPVPQPRNKSIKHQCIVFEPCGFTLLTVMGHSMSGFEIPVVRKLLKHCLEGLRFLHEDVGYIHTDLKPENILVSATERSFFLEALAVVQSNYNGRGMRAVVNTAKPFVPPKTTMNYFQTILRQVPPAIDEELPEVQIPPPDKSNKGTPRYFDLDQKIAVNRLLMRAGTVFKICDIGNVVKPHLQGFYHTDAATYEYRAPENIFRMDLTGTFDIWSLGATAIESMLRDQIFKPPGHGEGNADLLQQIVDFLGDIPSHLYPKKDRLKLKPSRAPHRSVAANIAERIMAYGFHKDEVTELSTFLAKLLDYDKDRRLTAREALDLPFISDQ